MKMYLKVIVLFFVGMMAAMEMCEATSPRAYMLCYAVENRTGEMLYADVRYTNTFAESSLNAYPYLLMTLYGLPDGEVSVWATVEKTGGKVPSQIFEYVSFYSQHGTCVLKDTHISDDKRWHEDTERGKEDAYTTYMVYTLTPEMLQEND